MVRTNSRVLRLITRLNVGGPARQALLLTRSLAGDFPTVLAAGKPTRTEGELGDPRVQVHHVPFVRRTQPREDARAVRAVRQLLDRHRPAVMHTHMAKAGAIGRVVAHTTAGRRRPRTVHTFHGHVLDSYFSPKVQRAFVETERWLARRTDVLVAVSGEIRDELLDMGIGRPDQYRVIPLGLDLGGFLSVEGPSGKLRTQLGLTPDVPLVGVVGRLVPIKDHTTLLSALRHLDGVHLAVLGDGDLRPELEARVIAGGLAGRVHFTGWWDDVASAVSDLDVVVLSSLNEGTPVALIEALAARRAVVATDVGGTRSVVLDGVTGLLTRAGDSEGIAQAIRTALSSPQLRHQFGLAGRRHVRERFGERRLVDDIRSLYTELVT